LVDFHSLLFGTPWKEPWPSEDNRLPGGRMVWEDIEDEELGLLEGARQPVREKYYSALGWGLMGFIIVFICVLVIMFILIWFLGKAMF